VFAAIGIWDPDVGAGLWGRVLLCVILGLLAVVTGIAMGVRDLRQQRGHAKLV
jgi:hypothetical protein